MFSVIQGWKLMGALTSLISTFQVPPGDNGHLEEANCIEKWMRVGECCEHA